MVHVVILVWPILCFSMLVPWVLLRSALMGDMIVVDLTVFGGCVVAATRASLWMYRRCVHGTPNRASLPITGTR